MNTHEKKHRKMVSGVIIGPEGLDRNMYVMILGKTKLERLKKQIWRAPNKYHVKSLRCVFVYF